ncbi:MAG: hypothetical protein AAB532_00510 [Patescibacteria group bacterium]
MTEIIKPPTPLPEAGKVYQEIIKPNNAVAVVGPAYSLFKDPGLLLASFLVRSEGKLYVVDPVSRENQRDYDQLSEGVGGIVTGIGNIDHYLEEISSLRGLGAPLKNPEWLGTDSGAQNIALPDDSLDVIIDHNTSVFLAGKPDTSALPERRAELEKIYREYQRVLRVGGKLLLQTDNIRYGLQGDTPQKGLINEVLKDLGFQASDIEVKDTITIPISGDFYKAVAESHRDDGILWYLSLRLSEKNGAHMLTFEKPDHYSPNFYIATKI